MGKWDDEVRGEGDFGWSVRQETKEKKEKKNNLKKKQSEKATNFSYSGWQGEEEKEK